MNRRRLTGGAGRDFFTFDSRLSAVNRDFITDFNRAADTIRLDNLLMTKLGAKGALNRDFFQAGAAADDADDYVLYHQARGTLSYDSNGDRPGGVSQLATLLNKPVLTAADFVVI